METHDIPSDPLSAVILGPTEEASRLWQGAIEAFAKSERNLIALCESLDLGVRAAEILMAHHLQPVASEFPATIQAQLKIPEPEVEPYRDAVTVPKSIQFTDLLDLLSQEKLECVSPRLHRGWEDRWAACARSRAVAQSALDVRLDEEQRDRLLVLAAYRNRIFRCSPPIRIVTEELQRTYPALVELMKTIQELGV